MAGETNQEKVPNKLKMGGLRIDREMNKRERNQDKTGEVRVRVREAVAEDWRFG